MPEGRPADHLAALVATPGPMSVAETASKRAPDTHRRVGQGPTGRRGVGRPGTNRGVAALLTETNPGGIEPLSQGRTR